MGLLNIVTEKLGDVLSAPIKVLSDWAKEPLKRYENKREQSNKDADLERRLREASAMSKVR